MNTPSNRTPKRFRLKWRWIIFALVLLPFLPQVPSCMMANLPKTGRLVDVTTGKGIPDAAVIAAANFYGESFAGSGGDNVYRVIVHTDANGDYWIPNTWLHIGNWIPTIPFFIRNPHTTWLITAFKPGYVFVGDEKAWTDYDNYGHPKYWPRSVGFTPPATWLGVVVKVEPLQMRPIQLSLREAAIYYRGIFLTGSPNIGEWNEPQEVALRRRAYEIFLPQVCNLDPEVEMDTNWASAFDAFVPNNVRTNESLRKLEPSGFKDDYMYPIFHAKNVCAAMKAGGDLP